MENADWATPPSTLTLAENEIHLWLADLDRASQARARGLLLPDELARAGRFAQQRNRDRFAAGRAFLRTLLERYTGIAALDLKIIYGMNGKPYLPGNPAPVEFNLSHSGGTALFAFCLTHPVGVDVEQIKETRDLDAVARSFLGQQEYALYASSPEPQRVAVFYRYWTCKEAYIKGSGRTLDNIRRIEIGQQGDEATPLTDNREPSSWRLFEIGSIDSCAAALATQIERPVIKYWQIAELSA